MHTEAEREGKPEQIQTLSLHSAGQYVADSEGIAYADAVKALLGGLPGIPPPERHGEDPLVFEKSDLLHWIGQNRRKLQAARGSVQLTEGQVGIRRW
jgi:hypothetical protein